MNIYVASSWRNEHQQSVVQTLRAEGYEVYDFRHPKGADSTGFSWRSVGEEIGNADWKTWTVPEYLKAIDSPLALEGFDNDFHALVNADVCVFVSPAGVSAALEYGFACGNGTHTVMYLPEPLREADLMFKMGDHFAVTLEELIAYVRKCYGR